VKAPLLQPEGPPEFGRGCEAIRDNDKTRPERALALSEVSGATAKKVPLHRITFLLAASN